jgi:tetratricopeptide (TPR) repeat protein
VTITADAQLLWTEAALPPEQILQDIDELVPVLREAQDYTTLAMAETLRFQARDRAGLHGGDQFSLALEYARKAGWPSIEHYILGWVCITLHRGTLPVDEAIAQATEIRDGFPSTYLRASAIGALGVLRAMKGEFPEARSLVRETWAMLEELGLRQSTAAHSIAVAEVEAMAGEDAAAERILRNGFAAVTAGGDEYSTINVAWRLGLALARQGRFEEAETFVGAARRGEHRGFWPDVWWRVVLALVEAGRGDGRRARTLVEEARERMAPVQESGMHADALLESAEALRAAGSDAEAAAVLAEAAGIAERLGYLVAQRRAEQAQRVLNA